MLELLSEKVKRKMQPPVVTAHDCSLFLCSFKQSKAAVRLKEDMKKVVVWPGRGQPPMPCRKVFGVPLGDLHKEGLVMNDVPAVVWNVVEYLRTEGMTYEGLFRVNGNVKVVDQLRVKYESGEPVSLAEDGDVHSAASLLKLFLREMPDGVISTAMLPKFIQVYQESASDTQRESSLKELIHELPETHYSLLKYLCHFLTQVVELHTENKMNVYNLATVFGPSCFHVSAGFEGMKQQEICNKIVAKLLQDYSKFFECERVEKDGLCEDMARIITVKEYNSDKPIIPIRASEIEVPSISPQLTVHSLEPPMKTANDDVETHKLSPRIKVNSLEQPKKTSSSEAQIPKLSPRLKEHNSDKPIHSIRTFEIDIPSVSPRLKVQSQEQSMKTSNANERTHKLSPRLKQMHSLEQPMKSNADAEMPKLSPRLKMHSLEQPMKSNADAEMPKLSPRLKDELSTAVLKSSSTEVGLSPSPRKVRTPDKNGKMSKTDLETSKLSPRTKGSKQNTGKDLWEFEVPVPKTSDGIPVASSLVLDRGASPEAMDLMDNFASSNDSLHSSQEDERPMSPFFMSGHVAQVSTVPAGRELLERTIRTAVEQHLFDVLGPGSQSSEESESGTSSPSTSLSARQRRRHLKEQDEIRKKPRDMEMINKENIPSGCGSLEDCGLLQEVEKLQENCSGYIDERSKPKRQKSSSKLSELNDNQESALSSEGFVTSKGVDRQEFTGMEVLSEPSKENEHDKDSMRLPPAVKMKIQEQQNNSELRPQRSLDVDVGQESFVPEVPRLDLTSLCDDNNWEEPAPVLASWDRDGGESEEARLSPQAGRLIRHLLEADSDPMLSPRFYAYGHSQQYLDDTEVPPSPPNSHSFMSRRRSSSLGSHEEDRDEDLTPAQITRKIQSLKKKIRKFEDKFEDDRKYRPSHRDKATNPEVLKWMNELTKFRKQLKESKIKISEEDVVPQMRQRSNTLPKSFGSQLEREEDRKPEVEKVAKPSIEVTMETIQKKLQDKRTEVNRPEDIKDMTRDQIAAEKVSLQKALLYYESIHGRPVTKGERHVMKPLYDRYRLFKQILYRANTIPVIGSPSSKRRSPLLQPIIEGETASFFKEEEEEGSEEDSNVNTDFAVTMKPGFTVKSFFDQFEDEADGFVSPVDDQTPSKSSQDLGLGNLHAASVPELIEQLQEAREEKKRIRKKLRDFEDNFFRQNGRYVQKEDRTPMAEEYSEYKHMKAKLRLLEVLISKRGASQTV
ncbi:protein FAM13A isoform X3 [Hyperolius riggenbachi]|uniref:protein FAM13A isoform X3 n=1 Tax=Hyperolius riggenbachi TaxID=752182 RepID=UPI0035A3AF5D